MKYADVHSFTERDCLLLFRHHPKVREDVMKYVDGITDVEMEGTSNRKFLVRLVRRVLKENEKFFAFENIDESLI